MRLVCCGRRQCLAIVLVAMSSIAIYTIHLLNIFYLMHLLPMFYHQTVLAALACYGYITALTLLVFESRNSLTRTFYRIHNTVTLSVLLILAYKSYNSYYTKWHRFIYIHWAPIDIGPGYDNVLLNLPMLRAIAILCLVVILVQGYLVYGRIANALAKMIA